MSSDVGADGQPGSSQEDGADQRIPEEIEEQVNEGSDEDGDNGEDEDPDTNQADFQQETGDEDDILEEADRPEQIEEIETQIYDELQEDAPQDSHDGDDFGDFETEQTEFLDDLDPDVGPSTPDLQFRVASPVESDVSPDQTPFSTHSLESSPARGSSSSTPTRKSISRTASGAVQPFERRFEARPTLSPAASIRGASPGFLQPGSRQFSLLSQFSQVSSQEGDSESTEPQQTPWEVIRWTKLRKIAAQAFSEGGKRNFGRPTCVAVSALIAIGTSKGLVLGFDYHQTLKIIIGQGTKATECGSVTALTISADYTTIASGHATGHIFTWEISKPARPFLHVPPLDRSVLKQTSHSDGHVAGCAVLHIGFLGTRHTALVSADAAGMAFSHLATRGLGAVTRTVHTTRLLGRYPLTTLQVEKLRKPSSVLAFSALPLGNIEQATDSMGLTALLTPYLLVIVSTTPIAQTQFKAPRPKEISPHSTLSGCLAWFPAVKLKHTTSDASENASQTKLVYCWSNILTVLDVKVISRAENSNSQKPPDLEFSARSRWRAEEAIVAVQWLGRSVLGVLTVSQRLLILEDGHLRVTDSIDLLHKHLYHQDVFSHQLQVVVENLNGADPSLHGVVADAFYMSFRAYKGRVFLLGFNDLTVGTLSNWADRLVALMEAGDYIAAIRLATDYYRGAGHNVTVGLPIDDHARHVLVEEKLLAMISASLSYTFSSQTESTKEIRLRELVEVCFEACLAMNHTDHLFEQVYEAFDDAGEEAIFITTLEAYIMDNEIDTIPTEVVKALVSYFISENQAAKLEELLCRLNAHAFDLDQITVLCRQHSLYDSLIYVWTQALGDYVTPLIDLLTLVKLLEQGDENENVASNPFYEPTLKLFPYLAYSFTGRRYPSGTLMSDDEATAAKTNLFRYLFSSTPMDWPPGSGNQFLTMDGDEEPRYPYLDLLLHFDVASFTSMLIEAFEDSFFNEIDDEGAFSIIKNGADEQRTLKMSRQYIIVIIQEVMGEGEYTPAQTIYFDMFIARTLPKYPGQIILSGSDLNNVLQKLCGPPTDDLQEECQLSVEYLLSTYRPSDMGTLIDMLSSAHFYRVLKTVYRGEAMYNDLLQVYFQDSEDKRGVFDTISFCLRPSTGLGPKAVQSFKQVLMSHIVDLAEIDVVLTSRTLATAAHELLMPSVTALFNSAQQFTFLRTLLEPSLIDGGESITLSSKPEKQQEFLELYVQLMCEHDPAHVADYVSALPTSDLRLDQVLPIMEETGIVDAAVILLTRDGFARDAMDRLVIHMRSLEQALVGLIDAARDDSSSNPNSFAQSTNDLVESIAKYTKVGLWLCQGQSAASSRATTGNRQVAQKPKNFSWNISENDLDLDEFLWLNLVDVTVQVTSNLLAVLDTHETHSTIPSLDQHTQTLEPSKINASLRSNVHQVFTTLLGTVTPSSKPTASTPSPSKQSHTSFLRILRTFLLRAASSSPSLSSLRAVLTSIFSSYAFERGLLTLATDLLDADLFHDVHAAHVARQRGWRPRSQICDLCKRRAWGTGIGGGVWDLWSAREEERARARRARGNEGDEGLPRDRGKGKATRFEAEQSSSSSSNVHDPLDSEDLATAASSASTSAAADPALKLPLVVFACRHTFHRACLDPAFRPNPVSADPVKRGERHGNSAPLQRYTCPLCAGRKGENEDVG